MRTRLRSDEACFERDVPKRGPHVGGSAGLHREDDSVDDQFSNPSQRRGQQTGDEGQDCQYDGQPFAGLPDEPERTRRVAKNSEVARQAQLGLGGRARHVASSVCCFRAANAHLRAAGSAGVLR